MAYFSKSHGNCMKIFDNKKSVKMRTEMVNNTAYLQMKITGSSDHYVWKFSVKRKNHYADIGIGLDSNTNGVNGCFAYSQNTNKPNWMYDGYNACKCSCSQYKKFGVKYGNTPNSTDVLCMYLDRTNARKKWKLSFCVKDKMYKTCAYTIDRNLSKYPLYVAVWIGGYSKDNEIKLLDYNGAIKEVCEEQKVENAIIENAKSTQMSMSHIIDQQNTRIQAFKKRIEEKNKLTDQLKQQLYEAKLEIRALKERCNENGKKDEFKAANSKENGKVTPKNEETDIMELLESISHGMTEFSSKFGSNEKYLNALGTVNGHQRNDNLDLLNDLKHKQTKEIKIKIEEIDSLFESVKLSKDCLNTLLTPNVARYKLWNGSDIVKYIRSLENGRFVKYIDNFRDAFSDFDGGDAGSCNGKYAGHVLTQIRICDLQSNPYNISLDNDRVDLISHFQALTRYDNEENNKHTQLPPIPQIPFMRSKNLKNATNNTLSFRHK